MIIFNNTPRKLQKLAYELESLWSLQQYEITISVVSQAEVTMFLNGKALQGGCGTDNQYLRSEIKLAENKDVAVMEQLLYHEMSHITLSGIDFVIDEWTKKWADLLPPNAIRELIRNIDIAIDQCIEIRRAA